MILQLQNHMCLKVWSSRVVAKIISKLRSWRGLQKNHAQLHDPRGYFWDLISEIKIFGPNKFLKDFFRKFSSSVRVSEPSLAIKRAKWSLAKQSKRLTWVPIEQIKHTIKPTSRYYQALFCVTECKWQFPPGLVTVKTLAAYTDFSLRQSMWELK